jgi:phage-related minor tail protein
MLGLITEQEKLLGQIQLGKFGKLTEQQRLNLDLAAQNLDAVKKSQEEFKEYTKAIDDLTGYTKLKEFTKQFDFLSKALKEGRINADQYTKAVQDLSVKFDATTSEMGQFAIEAARNIQNILGDAMLNVLEGKFSNIGDAFTQMLKKMVAQLAASQLSSLLFGQFDKTGQLGGLIGAAGSAIAGAFTGGFGTGNAYGNQDFGQFFAEGGYTGDGGNMEAAGIVHKGEYVLNAKATQRIGKSRLDMLNGFSEGGYVGGSPAGGMMGGNININIKNEAGGDGYQATATARRNENGVDIDVLVRRAVSNDLRSNGQITQQLGSIFGLRRTA